jgi:hypothetical protein
MVYVINSVTILKLDIYFTVYRTYTNYAAQLYHSAVIYTIKLVRSWVGVDFFKSVSVFGFCQFFLKSWFGIRRRFFKYRGVGIGIRFFRRRAILSL